MQERGIESGFDRDAPPVGKFHSQTAAHRGRADQIDRHQILSYGCCAALAIPGTIIIQRVKSDTARIAKCLSMQSTLFKILYQALRLRLAPTMSLNNRSRISHASTSTCNQIGEKSGFARMDTFHRT